MAAPRRERFVAEYLVDLNATQAAIRAGYSPKTANKVGPRLLVNVGVAAAVRAAQDKVVNKLEINAERTLERVARIAYADYRKLFDGQGRILPINRWPDDIADAVGPSEVVKGNVDKGDGHFDSVIRLKPWDKLKALEYLMRYLGLFKDRVEVGTTPEAAQLLERLAAGRRRVGD